MNLKSSGQSKSVQAIKLVFVILIFPILIGFLRGLITEIFKLKAIYWKSFYWGLSVYLIFHIFLIEPLGFYKKTQRFIQIIFGFFLPLFRFSYYIIPFWIIITIGFYLILYKIFKLEDFKFIFFFLSGFLFSMHIVMVAKILKVDELRKLVDYLFIIFIVLIVNIFFLGLNLKFYEPSFSVANLGREGINLGTSLAKSIFSQLFLLKAE